MMNKLYLAALGIFGSVTIASPIFAFGFTSDLNSSNWLSSGDVKINSITTASLSNAINLADATANGSDDVDGSNNPVNLNFSGISPISAAGPLQTFLGLAANPTALDIGGQAQEGSAIKQTFTAAAGDIISFNLNINRPIFDPQFPDYVFVLLNGTITTFTGTGNSIFNSGGLSAGTKTIAIGVVDINDSVTSSQVVISNVAFTPVPFEFSPAIGLGLLGVLGVVAKLRKNKKKS